MIDIKLTNINNIYNAFDENRPIAINELQGYVDNFCFENQFRKNKTYELNNVRLNKNDQAQIGGYEIDIDLKSILEQYIKTHLEKKQPYKGYRFKSSTCMTDYNLTNDEIFEINLYIMQVINHELIHAFQNENFKKILYDEPTHISTRLLSDLIKSNMNYTIDNSKEQYSNFHDLFHFEYVAETEGYILTIRCIELLKVKGINLNEKVIRNYNVATICDLLNETYLDFQSDNLPANQDYYFGGTILGNKPHTIEEYNNNVRTLYIPQAVNKKCYKGEILNNIVQEERKKRSASFDKMNFSEQLDFISSEYAIQLLKKRKDKKDIKLLTYSEQLRYGYFNPNKNITTKQIENIFISEEWPKNIIEREKILSGNVFEKIDKYFPITKNKYHSTDGKVFNNEQNLINYVFSRSINKIKEKQLDSI